jgi:hypothetical protein
MEALFSLVLATFVGDRASVSDFTLTPCPFPVAAGVPGCAERRVTPGECMADVAENLTRYLAPPSTAWELVHY